MGDLREMTWIPTKNDAVLTLFRSHPNEWLHSDAIAAVGGKNAWRTRVSNVRRRNGLTIENRVRRAGIVTTSEYRLVETEPK